MNHPRSADRFADRFHDECRRAMETVRRLVVIGDGTGSRDSRYHGFYSAKRILGVVIRPGRLARR
ncbi:hypothetical protein Ssi03_26180 [Sphaerisporangium siamense]|nr:hypothetical protein Ssi03_26180 [Sphaerisporangium siamense]